MFCLDRPLAGLEPAQRRIDSAGVAGDHDLLLRMAFLSLGCSVCRRTASSLQVVEAITGSIVFEVEETPPCDGKTRVAPY